MLYGPSGVMYGNNRFDNLERQGTLGNYKGSDVYTPPTSNEAGQVGRGAGNNIDIVGGTRKLVKFGSNTKSVDKLNRQMNKRGWTNDSVNSTVEMPFTTRKATNRATGNPATVYYNKDGAHVIVDDITNEVVQVSEKTNSNWIPDPSIIDPYLP